MAAAIESINVLELLWSEECGCIFCSYLFYCEYEKHPCMKFNIEFQSRVLIHHKCAP